MKLQQYKNTFFLYAQFSNVSFAINKTKFHGLRFWWESVETNLAKTSELRTLYQGNNFSSIFNKFWLYAKHSTTLNVPHYGGFLWPVFYCLRTESKIRGNTGQRKPAFLHILRSEVNISIIVMGQFWTTKLCRPLIIWSKIKNQLVGLTSCSNAGCQTLVMNCTYSLIFF